ncbi:MAG TPA: iron ABC transporter permease [Acidimicrobiales bacterium]|nr:iron ABC transporter permease [Acidimicrobiales bacterium]
MHPVTDAMRELSGETSTAVSTPPDDRPPTAPARPRGRRALVAGGVLGVALVISLIASASIGQFHTSPSEVLSSLYNGLIHGVDPSRSQVDGVLWSIRFPRAALAALIGASLAVSGAVMQGVFANPLAEPSIIGVNAGASVGAAIVFVFGYSQTAVWSLPLAAFLGAVATAFAVWGLSRVGGTASVLTLILTGIAVNAVAVAVTSFLIFMGDRSSREQVIFWQLGTLAGARWPDVGVTAAVFAGGFAACLAIRRQIDVLALGDTAASSTGVSVERLRFGALILVSILTAVAVAFAGVIAFVGLIVPHALRLAVGPSHRYLVPLSALGGAVLLSVADIAARTVVPFADLPIGIFTAVVGGPLFLVMLRRTLSGYQLGR